MAPEQIYISLLVGIRRRFDAIEALDSIQADSFSKAEFTAFQSRKIIEAIAFSCLVALHNGLKIIPNDSKGQWNAEVILKRLKKRHPETFPGPNKFRRPLPEDNAPEDAKIVFLGVPERRLTHDSLIEMYQRMHSWLHEINPYTSKNKDTFLQDHASQLKQDVQKLHEMLECHFISISGEGFMAFLSHPATGAPQVMSLSKVQA
ncbi:hypothetical protein LJR125_001805 [Pseudoxanthomonas sp. LjRoot125]|uniref:hypothetical protein n=1 Tax=Pseudoxanthomonas sp. LjRoot125 TaxID=3342258 RepID=UPI003E120A8B